MAAVQSAALQRAPAAGLSGLLLAGVDQADWQAQAAVARRCPPSFVVARSYGLHPQVIDDLDDVQIDAQLAVLSQALAGQHRELPPPQAIGELGLDALTSARRATLPRQERVFRAQLALARQADVPLVLHILRSHGQALRVLRQDGVPRSGGVVHSYSGSAELVADYLALGLCISFSGAITLPQAHRLHAAARCVPSDRLLIETDAPFQTPICHRPAANEPAFLPAVCASLAALRDEDPLRLAQSTAENARRLFRLPPAARSAG